MEPPIPKSKPTLRIVSGYVPGYLPLSPREPRYCSIAFTAQNPEIEETTTRGSIKFKTGKISALILTIFDIVSWRWRRSKNAMRNFWSCSETWRRYRRRMRFSWHPFERSNRTSSTSWPNRSTNNTRPSRSTSTSLSACLSVCLCRWRYICLFVNV